MKRIAAAIEALRKHGVSDGAILDMVQAMCGVEEAAAPVPAVVIRDDAAERRRAADRERKASKKRSAEFCGNSDELETVGQLARFAPAELIISNQNLQENSYQKDPLKGVQKGKVLSDADRAAGERAAAVLTASVWPDTAAALHAAVMDALRDDGFTVEAEVKTVGLGDECEGGRIDVVARRDGGNVAIELDSRKPRTRSLTKLRLFDGFRIVGLRGVEWVGAVEGIDRVVGMPVRAASRAERQDKRTVNRDRPLVILAEVIPQDLAEAVADHRKRMGCALTAKAAELLVKGFRETGNPVAAAEMMIARGWRGFNPEWAKGSIQPAAQGPPPEAVPTFASHDEFQAWWADRRRKAAGFET